MYAFFLFSRHGGNIMFAPYQININRYAHIKNEENIDSTLTKVIDKGTSNYSFYIFKCHNQF